MVDFKGLTHLPWHAPPHAGGQCGYRIVFGELSLELHLNPWMFRTIPLPTSFRTLDTAQVCSESHNTSKPSRRFLRDGLPVSSCHVHDGIKSWTHYYSIPLFENRTNRHANDTVSERGLRATDSHCQMRTPCKSFVIANSTSFSC